MYIRYSKDIQNETPYDKFRPKQIQIKKKTVKEQNLF